MGMLMIPIMIWSTRLVVMMAHHPSLENEEGIMEENSDYEMKDSLRNDLVLRKQLEAEKVELKREKII